MLLLMLAVVSKRQRFDNYTKKTGELKSDQSILRARSHPLKPSLLIDVKTSIVRIKNTLKSVFYEKMTEKR